jgi:hypothetical protein
MGQPYAPLLSTAVGACAQAACPIMHPLALRLRPDRPVDRLRSRDDRPVGREEHDERDWHSGNRCQRL